MKTITMKELIGCGPGRDYADAVEMNVPLGELERLNAKLLEHGLELHVGITPYAKFVKVVKI